MSRIGSEWHYDRFLCQARDLVLECKDAGGLSDFRLWLRLYRKADFRTWWQFSTARPVRTCRGVWNWFSRRCRRPRWGSGLVRGFRHRKRSGDSWPDRELRRTIEDDIEFPVGRRATKQHLSRYEHQAAQ